MVDPPLAGVRVLDLSRLLPGPYCTMLLADLGADVIKVEPPGGDYARTVAADFGGPDIFAAVNRNKRGVAIDFRRPRGRDLVLRLAARADVFLESFRPGAASRWGLGYEAIQAANPGIIYCSLSGYGQEGPFAGRAGHDLNYLAVGGLLSLNGAAGGPPIPPGVQIADLAGGMLAALAIMAGLIGRGTGDAGRYVDVALLDAVVSWLGPLGVASGPPWQGGHAASRGRTPLGGSLPCYNVYACADGAYVALSALEPHFWDTFCRTAGCEKLRDRRTDRDAVPEVAALFARRSRAEWLALFEDVDACLEPVNDPGDLIVQPQVRYRGLVDAAGNATTPFRFAVNGGRPQPAPSLGQHTAEVLREAGLADAEIAELADTGEIVVAGGR